MKRQDIEIYIEELNLVGFAPGDRYQISESVQHELEQLFAAGCATAFPAADVSAEFIDAGSFTATSESRPATIGAQIAGSVYDALTQPDGGSK